MFVVSAFRGTEDGLADVQRLRALVYGKEKMEDPRKFTSDGRYVDRNDAWSWHVTAHTVDGDLVGVFKVTPREPGRPLKLEKDVPRKTLAIPPDTRVVEMARLAVLPEFRHTGVSLGLWQVAFRLTLNEGFDAIYAFQRPAPLKMQERLGIPVERLSDELVGQYGLKLTPTRIVVSRLVPVVFRKNPAMAYFFSRELPGGMFDPCSSLNPPADELAAFVASFQNPGPELLTAS